MPFSKTHAIPEPTILLILDSLDEILADDLRNEFPNDALSTSQLPASLNPRIPTHIGRSLGVPGLARDDLSQLFLVPLVHRVFLLLVLLFTSVRVQVGLADFTLDVLVVREFTPVAYYVSKTGRGHLLVSLSIPDPPGRYRDLQTDLSHTPHS